VSELHKQTFDNIKREHEEVVRLLASLAHKAHNRKSQRKGALSVLPAFDPARIEAAVARAGDAYAMLLVATAEGFLRAYMTSLSILPGARPGLSALIDRCRKEFNKSKPKVPIRATDAGELHDLCNQRNEYAHGYGASVFPSIGRVVTILVRFFAPLP
jgi:hypothetical protein